MKAWNIGLLSVVCIVGLSSCGSDPPVFSVNINSSFKAQVIPVGVKVVVVESGMIEGAVTTDTTGKLLVGDKTFNMSPTGNKAFSFTSTSPCADFGKGTKMFKYQISKGSTIIKDDQIEVTVNC